ncbi:MAG TPA: sensor histidine kinase, partial [Ktedonobacteraceae bacterium]|nr:sensor histidine kinase [Ktedonobacteraceae bacterium]
RGIALASDLMLLSVLVVIAATTHASVETIVVMELLFAGLYILLFITRLLTHIMSVTGGYLATIGLALSLNLAFPGLWGTVGLYTLCVVICYRLPLRWSLPLASVCVLALAVTDGPLSLFLLPPGQSGNAGTVFFNVILAGVLCWFGSNLRTQYLLVVRLHEVQEQLQEQMVRNEELATERERTRIARDIHDVLSHSLAVLSIQIQAARHLLSRDPERLATKLDDMATLLRESIAESRRVIGLLREQALQPYKQDELNVSLRSLATTFTQRTGIHCHFEESGTPQQIGPQQSEALHLALREMLTNAHRHGAARTVWITLRWREASLILMACDDGLGANAQALDNAVDGHHGLQGMRERAAVLGGDIEAGPAETGGFTVTLRLPFVQSSEQLAQKEKTA